MKNHLPKGEMLFAFLFSFLFISQRIYSQVETIKSGSFIINMGNTNTASINDDVKPYGLIYDLLKNYSVPVKWVIAPGKAKDGVDFIHNGIPYKGGTFIIPASFRSAAVNARITYWQSQGVVGADAVSDFSANVYLTLLSIPRWTLDAQNGAIAETYLVAAGIDNTGFSAGAYNWKEVAALDACDDLFVMPHADPTWASHNRLYSWNRDCKGSIWAACHAVSALENCINPANTAEQMNFLTTRTAATSPLPYPNNSLKLWSTHSNASLPLTNRLFDDPVAQYVGVPDLSMTNGSEQIFIPKQSTDPGGATRWRPGTKIISYDPTQLNIPSPDLANGNVAVAIAYGPAFGDPNKGLVMYQAGHRHIKNTTSDGPALRAFFNFSFMQAQFKSPQVTLTRLANAQQFTSGVMYNFSAASSSILSGVTFNYQWSSSCGGIFGSPNSASTTFIPVGTGPCVVTLKVTDNCGRLTFASTPIEVLPPATPPTAVNDIASIGSSCSPGTSVTVNVLTNDVPNISPISFTSLNQASANPANAGTWTSDGSGNVTFVPSPNFNGAATITYTVTNTYGLTSNATITVGVGTLDANGCSPNSYYAPIEVDFVTLANLVSQAGTGTAVNDPHLDDAEDIYSSPADDYINFATNVNNNLVLAIGSSLPLRAKDTLNVYWSKGSNAIGTISVQIGQSSTGPWTNALTYTNSTAASGPGASMISQYVIPNGVSGITHIRINPGTLPATNSSSSIWLDAVQYEYLSCVSKLPTLADDAMTVLEDAPATIDVLNNDSDPQGLSLTLNRIVSQPSNGKVSINTDGTVTYVNTLDNSTATSFAYEACNSQGYCSTATVNISISADGCGPGQYRPNPPGGAITKIFRYQYSGTNAAAANTVSANFKDGRIYMGSSGNDNFGSVNVMYIGKVFSGASASRGLLQFDISEIPNTAIVQSSTFSVVRSGGNTDQQVLYLHGLNEGFTESEFTWTERSVGVNWSPAPGGTFGSAVSSTLIKNNKNRYYWDAKSLTQGWVSNPASNFGVALKTLETLNKLHYFYTKENSQNNRPQLTVTYVIPDPCTPVPNHAPLANPDNSTTVSGQAVVISPLGNDFDIDAGNTFTITGVSGITAGTATFTGTTITYTANVTPIVPRTERLTYTITDNNGATDQAYVYIQVTNAPPSINKDYASTNSGTQTTINVLTNDFDPEGGALTAPVIVITAPAKNGSATVVGNNIQYMPGPGFTGNDTIVYRVCEVTPGSCSPVQFCDTALVVVTVLNQPPVANNDSKTILPCIANTINLLSNDTDPEEGSLSITSISPLSNPAAGTLVNNNDGTVTFTPTPGFAGVVTFTYLITDNGITPLISSTPGTVTITVMNPPANSAPIAVNDVESTNMDHPLYASVLDNDSDPDNQQLTNPVITVQPAHGSAIVLANGLIQYTPNPGYSGNDILTYQICDNEINPGPCSMSSGLCATATLTITIVAPNTVVPVNDEHSTWVNTLVSGSVMTNDYDPQGDTPLVFRGFNIGGTLFNSGAHVVSGTSVAGVPVVNAGSLNINAAGTYTFTPANNFEGVVRVPYIIADANVNAASDTAVLQLTINPLPATKKSLVANNDENTTYGSAVTNNVLVNDRNPHATTFTVTSFLIDSDGDGVPDLGGTVGSPVTIAGQTITGMSVTNAGSITLNANGAYTFTPATDFHGKVNLQYTICDNGSPAACATAILHIAILNDINGSGNDIPVVGDDFNFTPLNTAVSGSFFNNDRDPNGDQLSLSGTNIVTGGPHTLVTTSATTHGGSVQLFADGTYTYTPANGYSGPDDVTYTLCDVTATAPQPLCKTAQIHFLVAADDAPVAVNDVNSTNEDTPVSGTVVGNDTPSVDGGNTWTLIGVNGGASHGTVSMNPDGTYTYTPNANYNGTDVFTYQVCDVDGDCSTATVTITINPVDDVPVAVNDTNTTNEDTPVSGTVVGNDTPSGDGGNVWTLVGVNGGASHGTVSMNPDGTYTYTPNANYNGTDVFSYQVCDVDGDCSTATVTITINPTNDVPVAVNDTNSTNEDTPVSGTVVGNDTPSPDGGNVWTLVGVNGGASHGTVTMNPDGTYTYTPNANYNGTDVFTYQVCDIDNDCSTATVTITINPVDDVPIAVNDTNTTSEDTPVSGTVVTNDTPSGDGGNIWSLTGVNGGALHGTVTMNPDGTYTYNPNANYNGTDVFTYHVCDIDGDCSTATVTITIIPVNDVPVAVNDTNTTNEDTPVSGTVVPNDTQSGDGGNVWTLIGVNGGAAHGTVTMNPDGTYTYTPNANYNGVDVFNYRLCDVDGDCSSATVTITIIPVNDVPVAVNDTNTTNEDTPVSGTVTSNDTQSGDGGNNWSLVGINGGAAHGSVTMNPDGTYTYTPNANYHGVDVFNYTLCDVDGDCSSATVTITIISVNDVPLAVNDVNTTNEDTPVSGDASVNDTRSGDEPNTWSLIGVNGGAAHGTVVMNPDGTYTYTPNANYNGVDVFNYRVCDVDGDCSPATVTITINPVNDVPVAVNDFNTTNEDTPVSGTVVPNDTQSGDGGNVWSLIGVNGGAAHGAVTMNPDGTYTYTPDANYNGLDVFNYRLCDIDNDCSTATVTITINPGNDVPLAVNDVNTTDEDTPVTANASINDTPSPDGGNEWSLRGINGGATHGTVTMSIGGVYTYTPATNFHGVDVFSYQVCDVDNDCSTATVTITILSVTDPFVTVNDENSTWQNKNVTGNVLNNDFNVVSDGQTFVTFMDPVTGNAITTGATVSGLNKTGSFIATAGTITFDASGNYNFIPASTFTGRVNIPYRVCGNGPTPVCDTAYLGITVDITPTTGNSVIANNDENVSYGSAISGNVLTNDRDPQYQGFTVTAVTGGGAPGAGFTVAGTDNSGNTVSNAGTLLINSNGTYSYTPAASFKGGLTVQYTITDIAGGTSTAQLHIDVITDQNGPSNDPPVAGDDFVYTDMNRSVQGFFYNNDSDPNNDPVSFFGVTIVPGGPHTQLGVPQSTTKGGIIQFYTDGSYVYLPPSSYTGPDYINYRICDVPGGLCSDAQIHFLVGPAFTTLPVTTLQAAAQLRGDIVTVKWNTESEVNTDYFEVERSTDNILFISLGTRVTAAGNSTGILNYSLDNDITSINQYPAIYYRVKLYGLGGETKYSNVVFVKLNQSVEITGWPNPFTSAITLNINVDQNTNLAVKLTDLAGRTICEKFQPASRGVSQLALNGLDKLANGIYMVTVTNSVTGDKTVLKFMKE